MSGKITQPLKIKKIVWLTFCVDTEWKGKSTKIIVKISIFSGLAYDDVTKLYVRAICF